MTARTVFYTRSSHRTGADTSDRQEAARRRLAEERGWEVVGVYPDRTSASAFSRPALDQAMDRIRFEGCDALIAFGAATISRSVTHLDAVISDADASGVIVVTADGCVDTSTAAGRFDARATAAFAVCESERAARIAEGTVGDASAE